MYAYLLVYMVAYNIILTLNLTMVELCNLEKYIAYFMVTVLFCRIAYISIY